MQRDLTVSIAEQEGSKVSGETSGAREHCVASVPGEGKQGGGNSATHLPAS